MRVSDLTAPNAIKTTIVITSSSEPENVVYYVSKAHEGKREQNDDGSWPDAITSDAENDPSKQQLQSGVHISKYTLKDGRHTVAEVLEQPKNRAITQDMGPNYTASEETVAERELVEDFQFWEAFKEEYGDYEIISSDKNLDFDYCS